MLTDMPTCGVCGESIPDGARFCPRCGSPVGGSLRTDERKMVTVLFADIVDSTGLARRLDAERSREVLGHFYDVAVEELTALRGQPEKFIGDAVMAVFGLPAVHEDDAVRAVRAGLALRDRAAALGPELGLAAMIQVRVGVESGEAATGIAPTGQLLVTGPVVNAAARLQTGAEPGEVLAGETTRALTQASVSFGEPRQVVAKGFDGGLRGNPVLGLTTRSVRRTIPFVGRNDELTMLRQAAARVSGAGKPLLFTVLGEPGIGKSRVVEEFASGLDGEGSVLFGRSHLSTASATFAPIAVMVAELAGMNDREEPSTTRKRLEDLVAGWDDPKLARRTADRLGLLLGLEPDRREESVFVQDVQSGFVTLIDVLTREQSITLVFEDVHLLKPAMLDLIERLAAPTRGASRSAFILATARPELIDERPSWGSAAMNSVALRLEPLAEADAVALAVQAGGGRLTAAEAAAVAGRAGGNPFFIVESTGMLLRRLEEDGGASGSGGAIPLPPTVQAMIMARLDTLPASQRQLARRLSVFLYNFDLAEAELVADCAVEDLQGLVDAEVIVREGGGGAEHWRFRHDTLRDVAYASLPKRERLALHVAIADRLEADRHLSWAADHLELAAVASLDLDPSDRTLPERATDALARAGDRARRRMENRSATDYYERALALAGDDERREGRIVAGIGESRYWLSEYPAAVEALDRAIELGDRLHDDWTIAHALRFRGDIAINVDADVDHAEILLARSLDAAESLGEPWAIARTLLFQGWVPWTRDRFDDAEPIWRRALDIARESGDRWSEVRALTALSINQEHLDHIAEATTLIEEAQELAEDMGDQFSLAVTSTQRGRLLSDEERHADAIQCFDVGIALFGDLGARWELADATAERGIAKRELGLLDGAEDDLRFATRVSEELGERQLAGWTWRALAKVSEKRGDLAQAEERRRRADQEEARRPQ
jgi:class 3 adenylate cyclase/tetratricopeptide (TPR) repeat protein